MILANINKVVQAKAETVETFDNSTTFTRGKRREVGFVEPVDWIMAL